MRGTFITEASDEQNFGQGGITLSLDRLRTRNAGGVVHVLRLFVRVTGAVFQAPPLDSALDDIFMADCIREISLRASTVSPISALKADGMLIRLQSGYAAYTTLAEIIGEQVIAQKSSQRVAATPGAVPFNPALSQLKSAVGSIVRKSQYGRLCQRGPTGIMLAAGGPLQVPAHMYNIPIGVRPGEQDAMNPVPASWFTGKGSAGGSCDGADVGQVFIRMREESHGILLDYSNAKFQVWAQCIALGDTMFAPLIPQVLQANPTTNSYDWPRGISGFHGFVSELDPATGDMVQPNLLGVSSITATVDSVPLWTPDPTTEELFGNVSQALGYDSELYNFGVFQNILDTRGPAQALSGPNNATRDFVPGRLVLCHRGPSSRSHTMPSDKCSGQLRTVLEGSPQSVTRQTLSGVWLPSTDAYAEACARWSGTPVADAVLQTPLGAISPQAVLKNTQAGIPLKFAADRCG